ncbi:lanthionine synthetase C family protein [Anaerosalibacter sp. Marseille-P3206]|uniref:lanthionine synthetase C family protein n=1 Tax=Anaerosalibacter sp. Marseille-P3206 TaxID=1871005 RepID=UPI0009853E39|nr:lanthionine synthetase C family protein [Anaerosalibacter sp. Marseille-P3206]
MDSNWKLVDLFLPKYTFEEIKIGIVNGIISNFNENNKFRNGGIETFLEEGGYYNYLHGISGILYSLKLTDSLPSQIDDWIEEKFKNIQNNNMGKGLLDGKTGIACVVYQLGHKDLALNIIKEINNDIDKLDYDITLKSGLSGIGLGEIAFYKWTNDETFLNQAYKIGDKIMEILYESDDEKSYDLLDGIAGVSCFYSILYDITNDYEYFKISKMLLKESMMNLVSTENLEICELKSANKITPYIDKGSIGILLAIYLLNSVSDSVFFADEQKKIENISKLSPFYNAGLLEGAGSGIIISHADKKSKKFVSELLSLYLYKDGDNLYVPGDFSLKFSNDIDSGAVGILIALEAMEQENPLLLLPIFTIKKIRRKRCNV